ncbi:hypothetical protein SAMN04488105_103377 [Salipiger thiooxidans]|uniref:Uncharacterized protein n=1 Tax=Salipiger thiooxidans TaxID=282683 RepID=A0A1G7CXH9_9RHOB|nr:hypothetical protein [Salipiger thiooxidans]SDE43185.1 hypothetical protein SAMN04488105_103377 [Salipiger thiooxidans]
MSALITILLMAASIVGLFSLSAVAIWWAGRLPIRDSAVPTVASVKSGL